MAGGLLASVNEMAENTPANRDRYIDFLRAFSITVVVAGHFTIAVIFWADGWISIRNAVGVTAGLWLATWFLQVMPIFFIVGGFSNQVSWDAIRRRGGTYGDFISSRLARLFRPTVIFIGVWAVIQVAFHIFGIGAAFGPRGWIRLSMIPFGPLWFLIVYMAVTALTPLTLAAHRRFGSAIPIVLVGCAAFGDLARFKLGMGLVGWFNLLTVWLLAHQLGYFYPAQNADPAPVGQGGDVGAEHAKRGNLRWWISALSGLAAIALLTNLGAVAPGWGVYPRSMLGTDVESVSNMSPPTLCIVALTFWLFGLAMLLRSPIQRWLARDRPWRAVIAANAVIMTAFLWHLTAYLIVIVVFYPLGLGHPTSTTISWWLQRPFWVLGPTALLLLMIALLARFERPRPVAAQPTPTKGDPPEHV